MNRPFLLRPSGKDYLWGGTRLKTDFRKDLDLEVIAETWECSTHPDGPSFVSSGEFSGLSLSEVLAIHPEYLGTHPANRNGLPILVKLIDAKEDLSIQVHPDDEWAKLNEHGQLGKTELWYVLASSPDARIVYGLNQHVDKDVFRKALADGNADALFQKVPIHRNDVFLVKAGIIHSLCAGALVVEVQESSNLTYRLYDYDRVDKLGRKRRLDIDKALDVADLSAMQTPRQPLRVLRYSPGCARELLGRCRYFEVGRMLMSGTKEGIGYRTDSLSFRVLLCLDGSCIVAYGKESLQLEKGQTLFVPAESCSMILSGTCELLEIRA